MISLPIAIDRINLENVQAYIEKCKLAQIGRVFLCCYKMFYEDKKELSLQLEKTKLLIPLFKSKQIEVGIWLDIFGHGGQLNTEGNNQTKHFVRQRGFVFFPKKENVFCPTDERYIEEFCKHLQHFATLSPDLIMFDDDFRFSLRSYGIGCACKNHMNLIKKECHYYGNRLSFFRKAFRGGENKYRDAWCKIQRETLLKTARKTREAINKIDPAIRLGYCLCFDTLDLYGSDPKEIALAFAGSTKPFFRTTGAPYWTNTSSWGDMRDTAEYTRNQMEKFRDEKFEVFSEGDVYPRPRYVMPASYLEMFHQKNIADHNTDILKYMDDYNHPFGYENGYYSHHISNLSNYQSIEELFLNKTSTGVEIYENMYKFQTMDIQKTYSPVTNPFLSNASFIYRILNKLYLSIMEIPEKSHILPQQALGQAERIFDGNAIPVTYKKDSGAVVVMGENARSMPQEYLSRGLVLDVVSARILSKKGIDCGFISSRYIPATDQQYYSTTTHSFPLSRFTYGMQCATDADIISTYNHHDTAIYRYQNSLGQKFLVLGIDSLLTASCKNNAFLQNYYLQNLLFKEIELLHPNTILAECQNNPSLSVQTSIDANKNLAVGLFNCFPDKIVHARIHVKKSFSEITFYNCQGTFRDNLITLSTEIQPYSFAGFNLKLL